MDWFLYDISLQRERVKRCEKFLTHVSTLRKNRQPDSKNKSFIVLKKMIHDTLISAKLKFFERLYHKLNAFLRDFQTDSPMFPFFADVLGGIVLMLIVSSIMCYVKLPICNNSFKSIYQIKT